MSRGDDAYAPDGSPVALYARLPPLGEAEVVHAAIPRGAQILELGAGAGRITHALVRLGHAVVAVDESPEMLAHVRGAERIVARIETLALARRFPVVLLASNLVNHHDDETRRAFLSCCARHVAGDGEVLIQRLPPDWRPRTEWSEHGPVRMRLREVAVRGAVVAGEMEYVVDGRALTHAFASRILDDEELEGELAAAGLRLARTLDDRREWIGAVPARARERAPAEARSAAALPQRERLP